jgi:hypothetical protein
MGWDKNTWIGSNVDSIVETLDKLGHPYSVQTIGHVRGYGLNDNDNQEYALRRLRYDDKVVLEYIQRSHDCDIDDCIDSAEYDASNEPTQWVLEYYSDCNDFGCADDCSVIIDLAPFQRKDYEQIT